MLKTLDLFSGIGGFSLGLERTGGFETVAFCEIDPYCRKVLAKHWPDVPIHEDVRELTGDGLGQIDIICGGFPCQDISFAGKQAGIKAARSGLWSHIARLVSDIRPRYAIVENVAALLGFGIDTVLGNLAEIGYDAEWHCIPASAVGAPHGRDRVWIIAYPQNQQTKEGVGSLHTPRLSWKLGRVLGTVWFPGVDQPDVLRVDDGVPVILDGHEALGNSVVPQVVEMIGRAILGADEGECRMNR